MPIGRVDRDTVAGAIPPAEERTARKRRAPSPPSIGKLPDAVMQFTSQKPASWSNRPQARSTIRSRLLWRTVRCLGDLLRAALVDTPLREAGAGKDYWSPHGTGAVGRRTATGPSSRPRHAGCSRGWAWAGMPPSRSPAGRRAGRLSACPDRPIGRPSLTEEPHSGAPAPIGRGPGDGSPHPNPGRSEPPRGSVPGRLSESAPGRRAGLRRGVELVVPPGRSWAADSHGPMDPPNQGLIEYG
jgi:hypothetical protein